MNVYRISGGVPLTGTVQVAGSKNAALAILSAVLLGKGTTILHNVPDVSDIHIKLKLLSRFGAKYEWREGSLFIDCSSLHRADVEEELVRPIRTSFYILGSLLARLGEVTLPAPGGCKIGARPVDFHVKGLQHLGAEIELVGGIYEAKAKELVGAEIYLDYPSAGATQHLMATACLARGNTTIKNAAMEPEIIQLADFLIRMGARIEGAGTSTITITGITQLESTEYWIPADRLQAGTYLLAGAITGGEVTVTGVMPEHQAALISKMQEAGIEFEEGHDYIKVLRSGRPKAIRVKTMPYPGFPTDIQQPFAALLAIADGISTIEETIYESRTGHVDELNRMGANISVQGGRIAHIEGVEQLTGATVEASDLRAGAALVLAGLAAKGETIVKNIHFIDRGYVNFEETLRELGATIERVPPTEAELALP
ncbi:MAG: UDP-N-acetylglucosamine 1-carboxyvinyltransferase [Armatimonadetes bacterium]|nr:UDP-N-acetylglucosamine 1-carboxyvinyltransferase [Armatimonadota bacterium]